MRWLLLIAVIAVPAIALARPRVAVAPLDGDSGNKLGNAVAKAAGEDAAVTGPRDTGKAMDRLGLSGELDRRDQKKLRARLDVDIVIQGHVDGEGRDKSVELSLAGKGIKASKLRLRFKSATSASFKRDLRDALAKRLAHDSDDGDDDDDDDRPKHGKRVADDDDDGGSVHKKKHRKHKRGDRDGDGDDDEAPPRHPVTQVAIRLDAGAGIGRRGLTYEATGVAVPPPVGTAAPSGRLEVEAYPGSMSTLDGVGAGIGVYGEYDMAFGVSIKVPGSGGKSAAISQSHYAIGVRYRATFGQSSFAFGVGYAARKYVADRSGLGMTVLDMPDVKYSAISPNVVGRFAATPTVGVFVGAAILFLRDAGPIATNDYYGYAKTLAFDASGGADIELAKGYGLRLAAEVSQVGFSFRTTVRGVSAATDRTIGAVASFEVLY